MTLKVIRRPFRGPSRQRGIIIATPIFGGVVGGMVVLTGYSSVFFSSGVTVHSGVAFQNDGTIDDIGPVTTDRTQVKTGEWWSDEPEASIGDLYDVRCASLVSGTWSIQAASVGTYIQISAERRWSVSVIAMNSPDLKACVGLFEIRLTGVDPVLDSANHGGEASN